MKVGHSTLRKKKYEDTDDWIIAVSGTSKQFEDLVQKYEKFLMYIAWNYFPKDHALREDILQETWIQVCKKAVPYKLRNLEKLDGRGIPEQVLVGLKELKGQGFVSKKEFLQAVRTKIGIKQTLKFRKLIIEHAANGSFKAWISTIVRNLCLTELRKQGKSKIVSMSIAEGEPFTDIVSQCANAEHCSHNIPQDELLQRKHLRDVIRENTHGVLTASEQEIIFARFINDQKNKEIACEKGISESNVSTTINRAIKKLRCLGEEGLI